MAYRGMSGWTGVGKHGTESALNALSDVWFVNHWPFP